MGRYSTRLLNMYQAMSAAVGDTRWWPGAEPFEIMLGVVLTQNTNWNNVERALENIRAEGLLSGERLHALPEDRLAELIRPAGYFRIKAKRLKSLLHFLREECGFDLNILAGQDMESLREKLLQVRGIGPESADSMMLYALKQPTFVVDAYTQRIAHRHGLAPEDVDYEELRALFMDALPGDRQCYHEFHALIVRTAQQWCRKTKPLCAECPLAPFLETQL